MLVFTLLSSSGLGSAR